MHGSTVAATDCYTDSMSNIVAVRTGQQNSSFTKLIATRDTRKLKPIPKVIGKYKFRSQLWLQIHEQICIKLGICRITWHRYDRPCKSRWRCDNVGGLGEHVTCHVFWLVDILF